MSYSAPNRLLLSARHSIDTLADSWLPHLYGPAGTNQIETDGLAIYVPIRVPTVCLVRQLWVGAATGTGNIDMGLYDATGVALVSATAAAKAGTSTEQVFDTTDAVIGPGLYYIALASQSAYESVTCYDLSAPMAAAFGVYTQTSAYPLPATATFAVANDLIVLPVMGLLTEATVA